MSMYVLFPLADEAPFAVSGYVEPVPLLIPIKLIRQIFEIIKVSQYQGKPSYTI